MAIKNIYLLGATGSIGTQTLDVIRSYKDLYNLKSIALGTNIVLATKIIEEFNVEYVSVKNQEDADFLKNKYPNVIVEYGVESIVKAATYSDGNGYLINALVGDIGLIPTIEAIKKRRDILLANKETLVVAGEIIKKLANEYQVRLLPIDSEHSAIFQALKAGNHKEVKKIIITASGGAFRDLNREDLKMVTLKEALKHPSWKMGPKITIDSATMVNKGLEVIEAHYLFDIDYDKIETIIHRESIIHSLVEYVDNSIIAQIASSDMRIPIQYALSYPDRLEFKLSSQLDLSKMKSLSFEVMDFERYPVLKLAYQVGKMGGIMPAIYNASNEAANYLFRNGLINFLDIEKIIFDYVNKSTNIINPTLEEILRASQDTKTEILKKYEVKKWNM